MTQLQEAPAKGEILRSNGRASNPAKTSVTPRARLLAAATRSSKPSDQTPPQPDQPLALRPLITKAWEAAPGDFDTVVSQVTADVLADRALCELLMPRMVRLLVRNSLGPFMAQMRERMLEPTPEHAKADRLLDTSQQMAATQQGARLRAAMADDDLYAFPLPGGRRLAEASAEEIRDGADFYLGRGKDYLHKGRWLAAVHSRMGRHNSIASAISRTELRKLFDDAAPPPEGAE